MKNIKIRLDKYVVYFSYEKAQRPVDLAVNRATLEEVSPLLLKVSKGSSDKKFFCILCKNCHIPGLVFFFGQQDSEV